MYISNDKIYKSFTILKYKNQKTKRIKKNNILYKMRINKL